MSPTAVGMASNFGHRSRSRRSKIFGYGRRTSAFGPTLVKLDCIYMYIHVLAPLISW